MQFQATTALRKIQQLTKRLRIIQGGSSAGKTIAILLILIDKAQRASLSPLMISVVSETVPHLKRGAIRDFLNIMETQEYYEDSRWNKTDFIYTFPSGNRMEFFSADMPAKVRGPRRNILFINEANNLSFETYTQLAIRTEGNIYIDYNPITEFWAHTELANTEHDFIVLTYKDNEALSESIVKEIESRRHIKSFWRVYGEGLIGQVEGMIYPNWKPIDNVPIEARLVRRGLDFGYTNDPTAIVDIYKWNDSYIFDEICYQKGMLNNQIIEFIKSQDEQCSIAADCAEPKSIAELQLANLTVFPARKGKDSIKNGINLVQSQKIFLTKRSLNGWKEQRNYFWIQDNDGKYTNEATPIWNHFMDAARYGLETLLDSLPDAAVIKQLNQFRSRENMARESSTR